MKNSNYSLINNPFDNSKGFTFVEILVVMVTMTILFSLGSANYRDFSRARELEGWARKVEGDLRLAQQYASVGRKPAVGCNVLDGYEFEVNDASNPQDYTISPNCEGTALTAVKTVELPEHVSIIAPAINPVLFKVLEQGTNLTAITPSVAVNVSAYGMFQGIIVTSVGEIYRGAAAATPTPIPAATPTPIPAATPTPIPAATPTPIPGPVSGWNFAEPGQTCRQYCQAGGLTCSPSDWNDSPTCAVLEDMIVGECTSCQQRPQGWAPAWNPSANKCYYRKAGKGQQCASSVGTMRRLCQCE